MAGTRLAIQSLVIIQLLFVVLTSVHYGFCRDSCKRGNLTKDLPLVPGLVPENSNTAVVQAQWWEDAICHPFTAISNALNDERLPTQGDTNIRDITRSTALKMTLAIENATQIPQWIDIVSKGLQHIDESNDGNWATSFTSLLSSNPMSLEILPPLQVEKTEASIGAIWSHYKSHGKLSEQSQEQMVVYIPAWLPIDETAIEWKAFDVNSIDKKSSTTIILAASNELGKDGTSSRMLQRLVEDWMARSILSQPEREKNYERIHNDETDTTPKTRLTREFPIEHFMAVLLPLLFPLMMPFLISLIKEYKRYKKLVASKKEKTAQSITTAEPSKAPDSSKTKAE